MTAAVSTGPVPHRCRLPAVSTLEFMAFRQIHQEAYCRYALARTGDERTADESVCAAFDDLAAQWPMALSSACAAATAWEILGDAVACHTECVTAATWAGHCLLERAQADVVLLHRRLGLTVKQAAALMGLGDHVVRALLRTAERALRAMPFSIADRLGFGPGSGAHVFRASCAGGHIPPSY